MKELSTYLIITGLAGGIVFMVALFSALFYEVIKEIVWHFSRSKVELTEQEIKRLDECKMYEYQDIIIEICNKRKFSFDRWNYNKAKHELLVK